MGILDHKRTWRFELSAAPKSCTDAFVHAMTRSKGALSTRKANWKVRPASAPDAQALYIATYAGRGGIGAAAAVISRQAELTGEAAKGSELSFRVHRPDESTRAGATVCSLWLSSYGTRLVFFTADAPIYRSYMSEVARALAKLDGNLRMEKL